MCAIPCLNEEVAIGSIVLRALRHVDQVLVIDDGSTDRTAEVARMAGATVISHSDNLGKGAAYRTFWKYARDNGFDALVTLDGDGQHDPDEIPLLLQKLKADYDFVIGARWGETTQMPLWRKVGKRVLDYSTALASRGQGAGGPKLTDSQSGFRAYTRTALMKIEPNHSGFSVESQLLMDAHEEALRIGETRIHCRYDVDGSTQNSIRHAGGVLNEILMQIGILHPLLAFALPGMLLLILGLVAGGWFYWAYQQTGGFSIPILLIAFLCIILGVLGIFAGLVFNLLPRSVARAVSRSMT